MPTRPPDQITEPIRVYDSPGSPNQSIPPRPGMAEQIAAKLRTEYVAGGIGGSGQWYTNLVATLPWAIDDVSGEFGDDLYQRMLLDPQIASIINLFKASVLENGIDIAPAIDDADDDGYALSATITNAAARMFSDLHDPDLDAVLWNLMDAIALGNRVAEQVYALDDIDGKQGLVLSALRVKPRHMTSFVVDSFMHLLGLVAYIPGVGAPLMQGYLIDPKYTPNLLPRDKFAILTFRPHDNDPRGTSSLRPAFTAWQNKQAIIREHVKFLTQFASPSLVGTTAEGAQATIEMDSLGNPIIDPATGLTVVSLSPEQSLLNQLMAFKNGTAIVVPYGATVVPLFSQGTGEAFINAMSLWDAAMVKAVLSQTLATEEGEHQARAAASVHQDVVDTIIRQAKRSLCKMLGRDILRPWVAYNWGNDAARTLVPKAALGHAEEPDLPSLWSAAASLKTSGYLVRSQYQALDSMVNLPERLSEELPPSPQEQAALAEKAQQAVAQSKAQPPESGPEQQPPAPGQEQQPGGGDNGADGR